MISEKSVKNFLWISCRNSTKFPQLGLVIFLVFLDFVKSSQLGLVDFSGVFVDFLQVVSWGLFGFSRKVQNYVGLWVSDLRWSLTPQIYVCLERAPESAFCNYYWRNKNLI